jgi:hypothetical protein
MKTANPHSKGITIMTTRDDPYAELEAVLSRARTDPAKDFEKFLGDQLNAKGSRRVTMRDPDAPEPVEENADQTDAGTSTPPSREDLVHAALERNRLPADFAEFLDGIAHDALDEFAQKLSERYAGPRRPLPNRGQGQNQGVPPSDPAADFGKWIEDRIAGR